MWSRIKQAHPLASVASDHGKPGRANPAAEREKSHIVPIHLFSLNNSKHKSHPDAVKTRRVYRQGAHRSHPSSILQGPVSCPVTNLSRTRNGGVFPFLDVFCLLTLAWASRSCCLRISIDAYTRKSKFHSTRLVAGVSPIDRTLYNR